MGGKTISANDHYRAVIARGASRGGDNCRRPWKEKTKSRRSYATPSERTATLDCHRR